MREACCSISVSCDDGADRGGALSSCTGRAFPLVSRDSAGLPRTTGEVAGHGSARRSGITAREGRNHRPFGTRRFSSRTDGGFLPPASSLARPGRTGADHDHVQQPPRGPLREVVHRLETQSRRQPVGRGEAVHEGHGGVPGLKSYLGSRAVRPNVLARDSSRLILVQVSLPMIAS
jgi:hypothetical protein